VKRLAIVTGAGGALGRAFARALIAAPGDWHFVLVDINGDGARAALKELEGAGRARGQCDVFDVADADAWLALRERLQHDWPRLDLLVNNAGVCMSAEVGDGDLASWRRMFDVNFLGVLNGCHVMAPWLKQSAASSDNSRTATPSGIPAIVDRRLSEVLPAALGRSLSPADGRPAVINVASIMGLLPAPALGAYCASKAAVIAVSEAMYSELRPHGVNVTVAAPGFFASSLLNRGEFAAPAHRRRADEFMRTSRIDAHTVARDALQASAGGRLYAIVGRRARWYWRLKRLAPVSLLNSLSRGYRRAMCEAAIADQAAD
jgi:NAD(P)-dependent dehydrogenase (short-subunit alcohol dehydrogenase family)